MWAPTDSNVLGASRYLSGNTLLTDIVLTNAQANFIASLTAFSIPDSAFSTACAVAQQVTVQNHTVCITDGAVDLSVINGPRLVGPVDPSVSSKTDTKNATSSPTNDDGASGPGLPTPGTTSDSSSSSNSSTATTMVIVAAAVVLAVALFVGFTTWKRSRRSPHKTEPTESQNDTTPNLAYSNPSSNPSNGSAVGSLWTDPDMFAVKIDANEIVDVAKVGHGGFCDVWLVVYRHTQRLAAKRVRDPTRSRTQDFVAEIKLVARLQHHRIVAFVGAAWTKEADLQALFEFMDTGDLRTYLMDARTVRSWSLQKVQIAIDIVEALVYVHSFQPPLVHRDLKSRNVLLSAQLDAKLTDFGVARYESEDRTMTAGVGTSRWLAPEVILGSRDYGTAADMFSLGVVLSEIDTHRLPYDDARATDGSALTDVALMQQVASGQLRPTLLPSCPDEVASVVNVCLSVRPEDRPSAAEVAYTLRTYKKSLQ